MTKTNTVHYHDSEFLDYWKSTSVHADLATMRTYLIGAYMIEEKNRINNVPRKEYLLEIYKRVMGMSVEQVRLEYHNKRV